VAADRSRFATRLVDLLMSRMNRSTRLPPRIASHAALGASVGLLVNASALAEPLVAREVIDLLAHEGRSSLQPVLLLSGLVVLSGLLAGVELWMLHPVAERIALRARLGLASRMLRLRLSELGRRPLGDLLSRVTSDTTLLRAATTNGVVESFNGGLALLGAIVLMGLLDGLLLLVTVGVLGVVAVGFSSCSRASPARWNAHRTPSERSAASSSALWRRFAPSRPAAPKSASLRC
jgi:ABC-type multidrug transport system fused ATPase/permease subunit